MIKVERVQDDCAVVPLDAVLASGIDTLIAIGFNFLVTGQAATSGESAALAAFEGPYNFVCVCPHHDIKVGERR